MLVNVIGLFSCLCSIHALSIHISELGPFKVYFDLQQSQELFEDFVTTFNKKYSNETEYNRRFEIFKSNLVEINKLNKRNSSAVFSITEFTDISPEEIDTTFSMPDLTEDNEKRDNDTLRWVDLRSVSDIPKEWDWREKNVVTPVKSQGQCNSCWAFAAVACIESQNAIKYKKLIPLSQQQLVDCLGRGCDPYFPHIAMQEVAAKMGGLMKFSDYPYQSTNGHPGRCRFNNNKVAVRIKGGVPVPIQNEEQLKQLVHSYGPVVVAIYASNAWWHFRGKVATAESLNCRTTSQPNHAVVIVGYGTENGVPYWIIKNSEGTSWGENGYIRLLRGRNTCNILRYVVIAQL